MVPPKQRWSEVCRALVEWQKDQDVSTAIVTYRHGMGWEPPPAPCVLSLEYDVVASTLETLSLALIEYRIQHPNIGLRAEIPAILTLKLGAVRVWEPDSEGRLRFHDESFVYREGHGVTSC